MDIKVRSFYDVIGQSTNKMILQELLTTNQVPDVMWFKGYSGSGKSTLAELTAMAATCDKGIANPCMECETCKNNLDGLNSQRSKSRYIKKINMAELDSKKAVNELIETVFDLEPIPGKPTYYIFEELQELKDYQGMFLERLRDLPSGVHIIGCTTNIDSLSEPFITRARLTLNFNKLDKNECMALVNRIQKTLELNNLTEEDKHILVTHSKNNARVIVNTLKSFQTLPDISKTLRRYFNVISPENYIFIMESLFKDFHSFIIDLDNISSSINLIDLSKGLKDFLLNSIFFYYCGRPTLFTNKEKENIRKIMSSLGDSKYRKLLKLSARHCKNEEDVEALLIEMHEIVEDKKVTTKESKVMCIEEKAKADTNRRIIQDKERALESPIKKLDLESISNITRESKGIKLEVEEWEE